MSRPCNSTLLLESLKDIVARLGFTLVLRGLHLTKIGLIDNVTVFLTSPFITHYNFAHPTDWYVLLIGLSHLFTGRLLKNDIGSVNLGLPHVSSVIIMVT